MFLFSGSCSTLPAMSGWTPCVARSSRGSGACPAAGRTASSTPSTTQVGLSQVSAFLHFHYLFTLGNVRHCSRLKGGGDASVKLLIKEHKTEAKAYYHFLLRPRQHTVILIPDVKAAFRHFDFRCQRPRHTIIFIPDAKAYYHFYSRC